MIVAVPKEVIAGEKRVALVPATVKALASEHVEIVVEKDAGLGSGHTDDDYRDVGARIEESVEKLFGEADVVLKVREPVESSVAGRHEIDLMKEGAALVSFLFAANSPDLVKRLNDRRISSFAMELMPRITRAQSMDALSSMSSIAGYKAALIAATQLPKFFPMLMTAAGTIRPARVLVLGAGVAGLQAIATAKRLGAVVEAYDIRPVVKEQVESLGGRFVELEVNVSDAQDKGGYAREQSSDTQERIRELLADHIRKSDAVITTALIPGKQAPTLVTTAMTEGMRRGSIIVDLAAEQGGNCELTEPGKDVVKDGITICGPLNIPSSMAVHASEMYSKNISTFFSHLLEEGKLNFDLEDEVTKGPLVTHEGQPIHETVRPAEAAANESPPSESPPGTGNTESPSESTEGASE